MYINTHVYELSLKTRSPNLGPIQYCVAPHAEAAELELGRYLLTPNCSSLQGMYG
jgi:hypothetical protein